jgi:hypothetical protein
LKIWLILFSILLAGWKTDAGNASTVSPSAANVYMSSPVLPAEVRRVLVLPFACEGSDSDLAGGCQTMDPVMTAELVRNGKFETVSASPETLRSCTGKLSWTGEEALPQDFFAGLKNVYACDAVMFCELTSFHPNAPLVVGLRFKLADVNSGKILWSADEIFDAENPDISKGAQQFEKSRQPHHNFAYNAYSFVMWCVDTPTRSALDDQWNILHSPRYFGEYSMYELLKTLPQR